MNRFYLLFTTLTFAGLAQSLFASGICQQKKPEEKLFLTCVCNPWYVLSGVNYTAVYFKADGQPHFTGNLVGSQFAFGWRQPGSLYAALELDWRKGCMTGSSGKRKLVDVNVQEKLGYTCVKNCALYTPYTGFGFRYLGHVFYPSSIPPSSFSGSYFPPFLSHLTSVTFSYYEFYFPFGFMYECSINPCLTVGGNLEWMAQVFTSVAIGKHSGIYWKIKPCFANFLVKLPFTLKLSGDDWSVAVVPFYEHWQDGPSTAKTSRGSALGLPGHNYNFFGFELNTIYSF